MPDPTLWWMLNGVRLSTDLMEWLLTYTVHSTLLIGTTGALLATPIGRRLAPAGQAWLWRFALVGGVVSASAQGIRTAEPLAGTMRIPAVTSHAVMRVELERVGAPPDRPAQPLSAAPVGPLAMTWHRDADAGQTRVAATLRAGSWWTIVALGVWMTGAAVCLTLFGRARRRFSRLLSGRRSAHGTLAAGALAGVQSAAGLGRPIRLTLSDRLTSPVAIGGSEVCLPSRTLAELDPIRMESILAHELAHLERGDPHWLTLARVVEAIFFFQPLNRLARSRMQEAAEFASDEWAAGVVSRPLDLAHCLARVAEWSAGDSPLPAPAMAEHRGTVLVRRVARLTSARPVRSWGSARGARLTAALAVVTLVFVAPRAATGRVLPSTVSRRGVFMLRLDSTATIRFRNAEPPSTDDILLEEVRSRVPGGAGVAAGRIEVRRRPRR